MTRAVLSAMEAYRQVRFIRNWCHFYSKEFNCIKEIYLSSILDSYAIKVFIFGFVNVCSSSITLLYLRSTATRMVIVFLFLILRFWNCPCYHHVLFMAFKVGFIFILKIVWAKRRLFQLHVLMSAILQAGSWNRAICEVSSLLERSLNPFSINSRFEIKRYKNQEKITLFNCFFYRL